MPGWLLWVVVGLIGWLLVGVVVGTVFGRIAAMGRDGGSVVARSDADACPVELLLGEGCSPEVAVRVLR